MTEIITEDIDLSEFDGEIQALLRGAAEDVAKAEVEVGLLVWKAGQSLTFAFNKCPHGQWARCCEVIGIDERQALRYRHVYERFPKREDLPNVGKQLLIELASPSTPDKAIEVVRERVASEGPVSKAEGKRIIEESKPHLGAEIDHDVDRTKQEPQIDTGFDEKTGKALLLKIRSAVAKAHEHEQLDQAIISMLDSLVGEIQIGTDTLVGLDDVTISGLLRQIGA